jgi:hypothetical protein
MKISELLLPKINPKQKKQDLKCVAISQELAVKDYKATKRFEVEAFNYLYKHKASLGIKTLYRFTNLLIDGVMLLDDGRLVALEIKYALNWFKDCNARVEFARFFEEKKYNDAHLKRPENALIIFDHFSGDWERQQSGWRKFYEEETVLRNKFPPIPVDIAQLTEGGLKGGMR